MNRASIAFHASIAIAAIGVQSCGGGGGGGSQPISVLPAPTTFTVGGTVTGLTGAGLVLKNNGGDDKTITAPGVFVFGISLSTGSSYQVTVANQPANQTCVVGNASGTVSSSSINSIAVNCTTNMYSVSGTVSGLSGAGLVLRNNGTDDTPVAASGSFSFGASIASGSAYSVTVFAQPADQACVVSNGTGVVNANVASVTIACALRPHTVSGTVSGLAGSGFTLQNNFGDDLVVNANGAFTFATPLTTGQLYRVNVVYPPSNPVQVCTVTNGTGAISAADVSNVAISCVTQHARFAFGANGAHGTATTYAIDDSSGQLRPRTIAKTGTLPTSITGERTRKFLYVLNSTSANISAYDVETGTGVLTEKTFSPIAVGGSPVGYFFHPSGSFFYISAPGSSVFNGFGIDFTIGALNSVPGSPYSAPQAAAIIFDPDGRFGYERLSGNQIAVVSVDAVTGGLVEVGRVTASGTLNGLYMSRNGKFLYAVGTTVGIMGYSVDATTGLLTPLAGFPFTSPTLSQPSLAGSALSGKFFLVRHNGFSSISQIAVNSTTGALSIVTGSPLATDGSTNFSFHPGGRFLYLAGNNTIRAFSLDANTGAATQISSSPYSVIGALIAFIEPSGKYAYVTTGAGRTYSFSINQTTGALTPLVQTSNIVAPSANNLVTSAFTNALNFKSEFAYTANGDGSVSAFKIDSFSGLMTAVGNPVGTGQSATDSLAIDMRSRYLYAVSNTANHISAFRIDAATGALTPNGSGLDTNAALKGMTLEPSGRFAYVVTANDIRDYAIDQTTGVLIDPPLHTVVMADNPVDLAVHPNGLYLYAVSRVGLGGEVVTGYSLAQDDGYTTFGLTSVPAGLNPSKIVIDPTGKFVYVTNSSSNTVSMYAVTAGSGVLTSIGTPVATGSDPRGIAVDPSGRFAYVANHGADSISTYAINMSTGALSSVGIPLATGSHPISVQADYSGKYLHVSTDVDNKNLTYSIDATTGQLTLIPNSSATTGPAPQGLIVSTRTQ